MAVFALRYELAKSPVSTVERVDQYAAMLETCAWGDRVGAAYAVVSEHHGAPDGYMSAPLTAVAAVVGRTTRLPVVLACLLAPINDPIRVAEQMAALDLFSRGRVSVIVGAGYRPEEFAMYGVDRSKRAALVEEFVTTVRKAWTGEPFEYQGRQVVVTPTPYTTPHPMLFMGGSQAPSARRAARLQMPYFPAIGDPELGRIYEEECAKIGFQGMCILPSGPGFVHVSDDPERDWARLAPYIMHDATTYDSWQTPEVRSSVHVHSTEFEEIKKSGVFRVVTPDECLALADELGPSGSILLHPLLAGMPPEWGWESLERFEREVLPRLAAPEAPAG